MDPVAAELDAMHEVAKDVFGRGDLAAYRDLFAPDLKYRRADGRLVGRDDLLRDARAQSRGSRIRPTSIVRESLEVEGDRAVEVVTRTSTVVGTAFFVIHRTWEYAVKSRFLWRKVEGRWQIEEMEVLDQQVRSRGFSIGFRAS